MLAVLALGSYLRPDMPIHLKVAAPGNSPFALLMRFFSQGLPFGGFCLSHSQDVPGSSHRGAGNLEGGECNERLYLYLFPYFLSCTEGETLLTVLKLSLR
jgi:hypothetical protein